LDPIFNRFTALEDVALSSQIQSLCQQSGVPIREVYVMDASRRSHYLNAYFTGLGLSKRVVLFDTLVKACPPNELLSVVAHELGHWKGRHIVKMFLMSSIGIMAGLYCIFFIQNNTTLLRFFGVPFSTSLVLLVMTSFLADLVSTMTAPMGAFISRRFERYADAFALSNVNDLSAFISLEIRLNREAKADLLRHPFLHFWQASHPRPEERIAMAEKIIPNRRAEAEAP